MDDARHDILRLLSEGKITVDEAERLLTALQGSQREKPETQGPQPLVSRRKPRYLRIRIHDQDGDAMNLRVPLGLFRTGIKLSTLLPKRARNEVEARLRERGIDLDMENLSPQSIDKLLESLFDLEVTLDGSGEKLRIYCE